MDFPFLFLVILTVWSSELSFRTTSAATINLTQIEPVIFRPVFRPNDEFSHTALIDLIRDKRQARGCKIGEWKCRNGKCIPSDAKCDGEVHCADNSDEILATCQQFRCAPQYFRCAYGACVGGESKCNGIKECADNSDELHKDCSPEKETNIYCILPDYPSNGSYNMPADPQSKPGNSVPEFSLLLYSCDKDYSIVGSALVYCNNGAWSSKTECSREITNQCVNFNKNN